MRNSNDFTVKKFGSLSKYKTFRSFRKEDYKSLDDRTFRTELFPIDFVLFFFNHRPRHFVKGETIKFLTFYISFLFLE